MKYMTYYSNFSISKRGKFCLSILFFLFSISLCSEFIANHRPLVVYYQHAYYFPVVRYYPSTVFAGKYYTETDYTSTTFLSQVAQHGWAIWAPIRFSYDTIDSTHALTFLSPPSGTHILGTDDLGRDVFARLLYGMRTSLIFSFLLTSLSLTLGLIIGSYCGYYGGYVDIFFQKLLEIWSAFPRLYIVLMFSSFYHVTFFTLLVFMLALSWTRFVRLIRAEYMRARNLSYVQSAKSLGQKNNIIMYGHILPNILPSLLSLIPWHILSHLFTLAFLDFLGIGFNTHYASFGELLSQAKMNLHAPWLAMSICSTLFFLLYLLVAVAESIRSPLLIDHHTYD